MTTISVSSVPEISTSCWAPAAVTCSLLSRSATHYVEQLSALRDLVSDEEGLES